jgi:integrase/recombinase XerD
MKYEITQGFKIYLQQLGYSKSSTQMLPACVLDFLEYTNTTEVKQITQEQIQSFYEYLQNRKHKRRNEALSETFINHNIYSLKVFLNWLEQTGQLKINPISNLKFKRPKINKREPLSQKEIKELFENAQTAKEIAILHLFYSCGLRRSEAENLNTSDIHFSKNILYIREGKGAKRRAIPMNEKVKKELEIYYNKERTNIINEAFILNTANERMRGDSYNRALKEILKRTSFHHQIIKSSNQQITLHHLRHSIATHLLENGLSIEFVRDFLGHSHLEATQIYTKVFKHQLKRL